MAYLQMREDCRVLHQKPYGKLFWNSNYNLDLRHACKRRQFDDTLCEDLSEACFWDLGMKNKLKGINGMQMELLKMMYHSVTECYVYVYIKCLSFQVVMVYIACVELPVRQNDSVENIPQSEALVESSVVCQEVVIKQHSIVTVCSKHFKPSDTEVRDVSMQQTTDVEGKKFRNLSPNGLKWFNGAVNIPLHICRKLLHSAPTAFTHLYNDIVHQTSLSAKDLTNCLFTFSMPRFRGPTYIDVLLNKIGQDQTELECLGSGLSGTDVKKNGSVKAKYKKDGTKNGKTDKTGHAKLDHERAAGGNVEVDYMNKASFGTKPREILPLKTGTHNLPGYKLLNWSLFVLLLLCKVNPTYENPVRDKHRDMGTKREVFHKFQLLKSEVCQNPEKNTECQGHNFLFEQKLKFCNYTCGSSEMVKCMNSPYGMVFFCIPNGTSCPKGIGWQFESIDGNGMVMIKESICPEGYYQVEPSKCHNACRTKHELLEMIPEGFKVVLKGNHIRQTLLMCDYKAGYFNADNKSFVNYDDNFLGHLDFCTHINHSNPCSSGQMPLYNGTCVEPCRPGYERDETDFLCKQVGYVVTSDKDTQLGQPTTSRPTVKPEEPKTTTTDNGHEDDKDKGRGINGKSENSNALPWYMYLIIALVIVGAGIAIIALVIKICCPQRCQGKPDVIGLSQKLIAGEEFAKSRNELLSQVTVDGFSELMKSVGALIYKDDVIGTVFRAGDCYVFTARHVVRKIIDVNLNGQYDFSRLETEDVSVNFNASVAKPACFAYRVCLEFYSNDPYLDFAVLRITNPVQLPKKMFLDKYNFERLQAIMLSGIGYGHPEQDSKCKKHLDPNCQIIFAIDDRITECRAWLEQNIIYYQNHVRQNGANPALVDNSYIDIDTLHNIFLDITMEHGGSGSPFLDNNGRVVGILTHGHPEFCFKLPKLIQLNFPKGKRFESVLRLDYIYNHIFERDPELAGKLFG